MRLHPFLLLCILCGCSENSKTSNYTTLEYCNQWVQHPMHPFFSVNTDKKDSTIIRMYTRGKQKGVLGKSFENVFEDETPVDIHLKYQTKDCFSSQLVAYFFDQDAELTGSDTLLLPQTAEWAEFSGKIQTKKCNFLTFTLESQGINNDRPGILTIRNLSISTKGIALSTAKEREVCPIKTANIQTWEEFLSSRLMRKKILALGETVHGTETLGNMAFSLMKERVTYHNSKLLLFELPLEYTLALNRYIKNDKQFEQTYADIKHRLRGSLFSDSILSFFNWVKEYNSTNNNEISLYGVDFNPTHLDSEVDLSNFLYTLNHKRDPKIDSLCNLLLNKDSKANEITQKIKANESIKQELTEMEYNILLHCISNWDLRNSFLRFGMRDDVMAATTRKLVTLLNLPNTTTTMYLHFGHASYHWIGLSENAFVHFPDIHSMGQQLKTHFTDDYVCLALTCYKGNATLPEQNVLKTQALKAAPESSIEFQMNRKRKNVSFLPANAIPSGCTYFIRNIGNKNSGNQFFRFSPQAWADGFVLSEETEASKTNQDNAPNPMTETIKRFEEIYKRTKH